MPSIATVSRRLGVAVFLLLGLCLTPVLATVNVPDPDASQPWADHATLSAVRTIQQTFTSTRDGLTGIALRSSEPADALDPREMQARVSMETESGSIRWTDTKVSLNGQGNALIDFAAIPNSQNGLVTLELAPAASGDALPGLLLTVNDWRPDQTLRLDGNDSPGSLAFQTYYATRVIDRLLGGLGILWANARLILVALSLLFFPGLLVDLVADLRMRYRFGWGPAFATWISISVGVVGVFGMAYSRHLGVPVVGIALMAMVGLSALRFRTRRNRGPSTRNVLKPGFGLAEIAALALLFVLLLVSRLAQTADMNVPAWVDGIEHAQRVATILDPSADPSAYYHYGFHFLAAGVTWLTGESIPTTILILGQVISALVPLAVYGLARTLELPKVAAWASALGAGFVSAMPAYYTFWGRYPLMLGWLVFPGTVILAAKLLRAEPTPKRELGQIAALSIALVGIVISHSRMAAYLGLALVAIVVTQYLTATLHWKNLARVGLSVGVAAAIMGGWVVSFRGTAGSGGNFELAERALNSCWDPVGLIGRVIEATPDLAGLLLLTAGLLGLATGTIRRRSGAIIVSIWCALLVIAANLPPRTPGCGFITNYTLAIGLFLPESIGLGYLVEAISALISRLTARAHPGFTDRHPASRRESEWAGAVLLVIAWVVGYRLLANPDPLTVLDRTSDLVAMAWISEHVPEDSVFLINTFEWQSGDYRPSDAGGWLPDLTGRSLAMSASQTSGEAIRHEGGSIQSLCDHARTVGVTHLYLGERGGIIAPSMVEEPGTCFEKIYTVGGVRIYRFG